MEGPVRSVMAKSDEVDQIRRDGENVESAEEWDDGTDSDECSESSSEEESGRESLSASRRFRSRNIFCVQLACSYSRLLQFVFWCHCIVPQLSWLWTSVGSHVSMSLQAQFVHKKGYYCYIELVQVTCGVWCGQAWPLLF